MHRKGIYIPDIPEKYDYTWVRGGESKRKEGGSTIRIS